MASSGNVDSSDVSGYSGNVDSSDVPGSNGNVDSSDVPGSSGNDDSSYVPGPSGNIDSSDVPGPSGNDDSSDVPGPSGNIDSSDVPGSSGNIDSSDVPGSSGNIDSSDVPGSSGNIDSSDVPGPSGNIDSSDVPGPSGNVDSSDVPGSSGNVDSSDVPGYSGNVDSSDMPGSSGNIDSSVVPGSSGNVDSSDVPGSSDNDSSTCEKMSFTQTTETTYEVHNHYNDRRVYNQGHIGYLSTGDGNHGNRSDTRQTTDQRLIDQLEEATLDRIKSWTTGMVETAAMQQLFTMIKDGSCWVTIKGRPGEGKTTLAYQALQTIHSENRRVFQAWKPEELSLVLSGCKSAVVMIDDVFGNLEFDLDVWKKWKVEIHKALGETEHHSLRQTQPSKKDVILIVVGRDYIFNSALGHLGKFATYFTEDKYVIKMTDAYERDYQEKLSILKTLCEAGEVTLDRKTVEVICRIQCPHGFPHVCKMFIIMLKVDPTLKADIFFKSPIYFLNQTVAKFVENEDLFTVFEQMMLRDGKVSVRELSQLVGSQKLIKAADNLVGSYLRKQSFVFEFDHPSIYDSVAFHFCNSHLDTVIDKCNMTFLHERIRLESPHKMPRRDQGPVVYIPRSYIGALAQRFATEATNMDFFKVLSHQAMEDVEFVKKFISLLGEPLPQLLYSYDVQFTWLVGLQPKEYEGSFLYYISSSQSPQLPRLVENHSDITLTTRDIDIVLEGACHFAASDVVTYLLKRHNIDINKPIGYEKETPLMLAAQSRDSKLVDTILHYKPNVSLKDVMGHTALHYLCEHGLASAVRRVIDMGCDVNGRSLRGSPLSLACAYDHPAVVRVLLNRGATVDSRAVDEACMGGNLDIVTLLFDKGVPVHINTSFGYLLHSACLGKSLEVLEYLIQKGASVNKSNEYIKTQLHLACMYGWYQGVHKLMEHGADADSKTTSGATPLHNAAMSGSEQCVTLLLSASVDVNIRDEEGITPLYLAIKFKHGKCVDLLLEAGAKTSITSKDGGTPLHAAVTELTYHSFFGTEVQFSPPLLPERSICQTLINYDVDVNAADRDGNTALHVLCQVQSNTEIQRSHDRMHWASQQASSRTDIYRDLVQMLVENGADTQNLNKIGEPALHGWCRQLYLDPK